jgi:PPM family protein phosphatase
MPFLELQPFGVTDAGKVRENNEDALLVGEGEDETLFAVADGIGGFEAGEVASSIVIDVLKRLRPEASFEQAIREANRRVLAAGRGDEKLSGMGTTVVAVRFRGTQAEPVAEVAHVGDSRAYLVRDSEMKPVTEDHSLVAELVRSGDLTRAQAAEHPQKNLITRALGADEEVDVDTALLPIEAGDRVLLCSDGLSDMVPETRISELVRESSGDPERTSRSLLSAALDAGGNDNITVVVVDVREQAERKEPAAREERRSGGTREMPAVTPPASTPSFGQTSDAIPTSGSRGARTRYRPPKTARRKRRSGGFGKALGKLVRGLAVILVVLVALLPAYLWGSSRYFFAFEGGEVIAYRGLPYAPFGVELNQEWQRPGLTESEIKEPYEEPVENHKLYTREQAERVLGDLGS